MGDFAACYAQIRKWEGGYANHPDDPGGKTNFGVTQAVYDGYRKRKGLLPQAVIRITSREVEEIYREQYWVPVHGDELPPGLDLMVFDFAINSGPGRAVRHLQAALGLPVDGAIGNITLGACREVQNRDIEPLIIERIKKSRLDFLQNQPTWGVFGKGWTNRLMDMNHMAGKMEELADRALAQTRNQPEFPKHPPILYDPEKARTAEPEPARKAGANAWWAGLASLAGVAVSVAKEVIPQVKEIQGVLGDSGLPATGVAVILGVAGAVFAYYAYQHNRTQQIAETPGAAMPA